MIEMSPFGKPLGYIDANYVRELVSAFSKAEIQALLSRIGRNLFLTWKLFPENFVDREWVWSPFEDDELNRLWEIGVNSALEDTWSLND